MIAGTVRECRLTFRVFRLRFGSEADFPLTCSFVCSAEPHSNPVVRKSAVL